MGELFDRWYENAAPGWAANTVRHTYSVIKVHLRPRFGHLPVGELTTADVDDFYAELRARGGQDGRGLVDATVRRIHGVLHRALAQAVRWQWVWTNPAEHASPPIVVQREIHSPPGAAVARLLAATKETHGLHDYFCVAVSTGARRGQMCELRWRDVDLDRGTIGFARALAEGHRGGLVVVPTKNRVRNRVEIDAATLAELQHHRDNVDGRASAAAGVVLSTDAYVFARDPEGTDPWKPNWVTKQFGRLRNANGLSGHRLHDLRHLWRPRCSTLASRSRSSRPAWPTPARPPRSTSTPTRSPAAIVTPPMSSRPCCDAPRDDFVSRRNRCGMLRRGAFPRCRRAS